jgi:hypothetical protein
VAIKNAGARKLRALPHEIENGVFPLTAYHGKTAYIDNDFAAI